MADSSVLNAHRKDPYKNYKFRILWDQKPVLGVSKIGSLKQTTEEIKHRAGGEAGVDHNLPDGASYEAITLERGITHDFEFGAWANKVQISEGDPSTDLADFKSELTLEVMNEKGQVAIRYFLHACRVSEFTTLPDLDANTNAVAIETLKLEVEGWERDADTTGPDESR